MGELTKLNDMVRNAIDEKSRLPYVQAERQERFHRLITEKPGIYLPENKWGEVSQLGGDDVVFITMREFAKKANEAGMCEDTSFNISAGAAFDYFYQEYSQSHYVIPQALFVSLCAPAENRTVMPRFLKELPIGVVRTQGFFDGWDRFVNGNLYYSKYAYPAKFELLCNHTTFTLGSDSERLKRHSAHTSGMSTIDVNLILVPK